jgi:DnaJ-class molecular chaperone
MPRDHYVVLGIARDADLPQIRRAYREASKRCHPDAAGDGTSPTRFIEVRNAYETLSDARKRSAYDAELKRNRPSPRPATVGQSGVRRAPTPVRTGFEGIPSPIEPFFRRIDRGFASSPATFRPSPTTLYVEVVLTPEEAMRGGTFPLDLPVIEPCPDCRRVGWSAEGPCLRCLDAGTVQATRGFHLTIPPKVGEGTVIEMVSDDLRGSRGLRFIIEVRISGHPFE